MNSKTRKWKKIVTYTAILNWTRDVIVEGSDARTEKFSVRSKKYHLPIPVMKEVSTSYYVIFITVRRFLNVFFR